MAIVWRIQRLIPFWVSKYYFGIVRGDNQYTVLKFEIIVRVNWVPVLYLCDPIKIDIGSDQ